MNDLPQIDAVLRLSGVHTHIGQYHILHGVDFSVPRGQVTVLLGRNGVGKTTCLRTLMGLWRASAGSVLFDDGKRQMPLHQTDTADMADLGIAYVPENMGIFSDLTVQENLLLAARKAQRASQLDAARSDWVFGLFPALKTFYGKRAGSLSGGQKQMLAVARAVIEPRQLLIVDEPSKGLAPAIVDNMLQAFLQLKQQGVSILLVEQNMAFAQDLGDQVVVMDAGRVVHASSMAFFKENPELPNRLLGLSL